MCKCCGKDKRQTLLRKRAKIGICATCRHTGVVPGQAELFDILGGQDAKV